MTEIARHIRQNTEAIAELECRSAGRPIRDMRGEAVRVAEMFEYYGGWCDKLHGEVIPVPTSHLNYTRLEPCGVVAQITPWNAPLFTGGWQIAPAIAAGNAVVIKPSELTPLSTLVLGVLCEKAGAPRGLVNVIAGQGTTAGQAMVAHAKTALVVFVGSAQAGAAIAATAARNTVPCILELGRQVGQHRVRRCQSRSRDPGCAGGDLLGGRAELRCRVPPAGASLGARAVRRALCACRRADSVGAPLLEATQIGPINNARQWSKIDQMVRQGIGDGCRIRHRRQQAGGAGG